MERKNENNDESVFRSFDISEMNRRILVPHHEVFRRSIIYTERCYMWYSKLSRN